MSLELRDLRLKITVETDVILTALSRTSGREKIEIARELLHVAALNKIGEAKLIVNLMQVEGLTARNGDSKT